MRTCIIADCGRKHVAKGLCASHYNRTHYSSEQRHTKRLMPCEVCGTEVLKHPNGGRYRIVCSYDCRYVLTHGRTKADAERARNQGKALIGPLPKQRTTTAPTAMIPGIGRPFIGAECHWCGAAFLGADRRVAHLVLSAPTRPSRVGRIAA